MKKGFHYLNQKKVISAIHLKTGIAEIDIQLTIETLREIVVAMASDPDNVLHLKDFLAFSYRRKKQVGVFSNLLNKTVPLRYPLMMHVRISKTLLTEINATNR